VWEWNYAAPLVMLRPPLTLFEFRFVPPVVWSIVWPRPNRLKPASQARIGQPSHQARSDWRFSVFPV